MDSSFCFVQITYSLMRKGGIVMKGYTTDSGYMGYVPNEGRYRLFETDDAYKQYVLEMEGGVLMGSSFYTRKLPSPL